MPPPVLMAARTSESDAVVERGERRDSEMLEADDWADTFVDSNPKYDPTTYNKRELAHRLDQAILKSILLYAIRVLGLVRTGAVLRFLFFLRKC